ITAMTKREALASRFVTAESEGLLADTFNMQLDFHFSRRRAEVVVNAVVSQLQRGFTFKTGAVAAPWVFTFANHFHREADGFGHAVQSEITAQYAFVGAGGFVAGALEGGFWVFAHVQEIRTAQVLVTLGMVGVHAGGVDGHLNG